ncbi:MAG: DUF2284 domain-containing protein [Desulfomonile sp.]|jgi:predicted metal-binding protein|nr:DUF2284 domain-containing protein [Deltaproteobacteria bacterium]
MDTDLKKYCDLAVDSGATHSKQINPSTVTTAPWVRLKCQFGCPGYAKGYCCPPHTPTTEETRAILNCYQRAILFHIELPDTPERQKHYQKYLQSLVELEGIMFKDGYYKAFIFLAGPCRLCKKCGAVEGKACEFALKARPSMESCGIDVYQTARDNGFFMQPLHERTETNNDYCLMLVD